MMTPQERQLIGDLFNRLSTLEKAPRDQAAERTIADAMARAPNAIYPLVQAVLVQEEALERANARIEELETAPRSVDAPNKSPGFLGSMRSALLGRDQASPGSMQMQPRSDAAFASAQDAPKEPSSAAPAAMPAGASFLGNAAAAAVGVIGGKLLGENVRSLFGRSTGVPGAERSKQSLWDRDETKRDSGGKGETGEHSNRSATDSDSEYSSDGDADLRDSDFDGDYAEDDDAEDDSDEENEA